MEKRTRYACRAKRVHLLLSFEQWDSVLSLANEEALVVADVVRQRLW